MTKDPKNPVHQGGDRSAPYPVSRLAPAFESGDLAAEVARAETLLSARTSAKLRVIADQIKALRVEARKVLDDAREEQALTRARCGFKRIPGHIYHLYRKTNGSSYFSMLSPADWRGDPPDEHIGSYRLEADYSWTPAERADHVDETGEMVCQLLRIGGLTSGKETGRSEP